MRIAAVDLFCGVGGLTAGLRAGGIDVTAGIDLDHHCKYAYEANNLGSIFINADISQIDHSLLRSHLADADATLLAGCAPCQPFSTYSRTGKLSKDWGLLAEFQRLALDARPDYLTMENVPGLVNHAVYDRFAEALEKAGYSVTAKEIYCPSYGVPQTRTRLVVLASLHGQIGFPEPSHTPDTYPTVRNAISSLPSITAGSADIDDRIHRASGLSSLNLQRIQTSKPGGTWRDWPVDLRAKCHQRDSGRSYGGVYGRMRWDKPSPTITTEAHGFGNGRFGHPEQDRAISLREAALLQTFPLRYEFVDPGEPVFIERVARHVGNAVPVRLGEVIAQVFIADANRRIAPTDQQSSGWHE